MPSGAKKRKAARKKLEKEAHTTINNGSHSSQGSDDPRSHSERDRDVVDVEREGKFEGSEVNDQGEGNIAGEVKQQKENFDDDVRADDNSRKFTSVASKISSSSSSTSSSSDDDEVTVEKEEPEEAVTPDDSVLASMENLVDDYVEESIPVEESVKEVVSLPEESSIVSESVPVDQSLTSDVIESGQKEFVDEVLRPSDEKSEVVSAVVDLVQAKVEEKVSPAGDGGSENTSESVGVLVRDTEGSLPQSSGVKAVDNGKMPETHKYAEEEPLLSAAPLPVQRTSVFSCCGLLEVFSGGSR
ncbi:uncharacterized protein LOC141596209 [Silene latifolia]|uniref:uncharacterized protein LOC141596209 n=1 Tax=Silene latifolia TaxID=37657 RepID=UPI003D771607